VGVGRGASRCSGIPNRSSNAIRGSLSVFGRTFALPDGVVPKALAMWSAVCTVVFFGPPG
jgi:hypothetical protein